MSSETGFEIHRGFLRNAALYAVESHITRLYRTQCRKIGAYRDRFTEDCALTDILEMMEANDKEALYQVQKWIYQSQEVRALFDAEFMRLAADFIGTDGPFLLEGPALFVNRPQSQRLLYKWHSEQHYYPKRRNFVNIWLPLFSRRTKENGAMSVKIGSHRRDFPFSEYTGYNKDTEGKGNHFVQYEIPAYFLDGYEERTCETDRGDVVLFHRQLVHTSNPNVTDGYSFAMVARVWDPTHDLTLSGDMGAKPYNLTGAGRADLVVDV